MISIVTPTYNRSHTLPRLYQSLLDNLKSYPDFEWIIMDDGSTDDTKEVVEKWIKENKIRIKYDYQENQGKMQALNHAIPKADGEIILEVDSDDYLEKNALIIIKNDWPKVEAKEDVYGIIYLRRFVPSVIENRFPLDETIIKISSLYYEHNFNFDTSIAFKKEARNKYQHRLEYDEKFVTEARMYNEMDQDYKGILCMNRTIIVCEYQQDGYSNNTDKLFLENPYGYYAYFKETLNMSIKKIRWKKYLYLIKHYILFSYLTKKKKLEAIKNLKKGRDKAIATLLIWPGYFVSKRKIK